jgi:hypothetical protein
MQRRKLVAVAGALSATAFAATLAIGANFGLVGEAQPDSPVGRLSDRQPAAVAAAADATSPPAVTVTTPRPRSGADD